MYCCCCIGHTALITIRITSIQSDWGTNFGCVFDGVSTGGKINVYAAQAFSDVCIKWLGRHHPLLNAHSCQEYAKQLFEMAMDRKLHPLHPVTPRHTHPVTHTPSHAPLHTHPFTGKHNPGLRNPSFDADGGSATGSFAGTVTMHDALTHHALTHRLHHP
jgi:hypothetical protein